MRYLFADCELDTHVCAVRRGTMSHPLRPKPWQVLLYLLEHRDRVVPKQELAERLWPDQYISDTVIENSILAARRAVGDNGRAQRIIQTLHGHGYRFIVPVTAAGATVETQPSAAGEAGEGGHPLQKLETADTTPVQGTSTSPSMEASRRQLTVLFCDLVGSTILSSQVDPEDYTDIIQAYHEACAAVIERFAGHIAQYLGDGLLVYFGYPQAHEDDAQRAVHTALGMLDALRQLNHHLQQTHRVQVAARLGVHSGLVVVSAVGTGAQVAPLALGETPNIAARLQELAAPDTVVLSAATYRLVHGYFVCHALGAQVLRHVAEPMEVYQVLRANARPHRFAVAVTRGLTPFVGRERERSLLLERWSQAREGTGQVVLISGDAGIGKSRLVQTLKDQVHSEHATLLECQGLLYHQQTAFEPLTELLPRLFQWQRDEPTAAKLAKIARVLAQVRLPVEPTVPLVATLLTLPVPEDAYPPLALTAEERRYKTFDILLALVRGLATHHPVLFIVEDLHWMDPSTLEFLEMLVEQSPTAALLLVVTCRPTVHPAWVMRSHVAHVTLDRLRPRLVQEMIGLMPGAHKLPAPVRQHIATATDGVPLFIEEVTKMLLEMGGQRQGALDAPRPARRLTLTIPATLQDLLMARLDRLGTAKSVAQLASTIGREFSYAVLQALAPWDASTLQRDLRRLVEAELLYQQGLPPQGTYLFKHALIRDAAYESLLKRTRQHYHQQIAEVLEAQLPETGELHAELVAHHALRGELWEKAVTSCQQAGIRAHDRAAFREAVAFFDQALQALARLPKPGDTRELALELRLALGDTLNALGEYERRLALLDEAAALARALDDRSRLARVFVQIAHVRRITGDSDGAMAAGRQALELAAALGDSALQGEVSHRLGQVYHAIGDFGRAAELQRQNVEAADRECGTPRTELQIRSRASLALTLSALGAFAEGRRHGEEALRLATLAGRGVTPIVAHGCLGIVYLIQGDLEPAIQVLEQGLTLCRASGILDWLRGIIASLGFASALQGRLAEGRALLEEAISVAIHTGGKQRPLWVAWLSEVCRLAGRGDEAWQHACRALDLARQQKDRGDEAVALHQLGVVQAHAEPPDVVQAASSYQQALVLAEELGMRPLQAHCHRGLGTLYAAIGQREQARTELATAVAMYRGMEMTFWLPETEAALGQVEGR